MKQWKSLPNGGAYRDLIGTEGSTSIVILSVFRNPWGLYFTIRGRVRFKKKPIIRKHIDPDGSTFTSYNHYRCRRIRLYLGPVYESLFKLTFSR